MVNDGYQAIMNIDISQVVIDAMIEKYKEMPQLQCNFNSRLLLSATVV